MLDLHGSAPDKSDTAILLIDVINDLEFSDGHRLLRHAALMAENLARLKSRLKKAGIPAIYVNDHFGRWQSNFQTLLHHCLSEGVTGRELVARLIPEEDDYFSPRTMHICGTSRSTYLRTASLRPR